MTIYYFSGTGNSLDTAKKLSSEFPGCKVKAIKNELISDSEIQDSEIGFVFPVYAYGPPRIVRDFILKNRFGKDQYLFALVTGGGTPANVLGIVAKFIKKSGGHLSSGFFIKAQSHPMNSSGQMGIIKFMHNISGKKNFGFYDDRREEIVSAIREHRSGRFDKSSPAANFLGSLISGMAIDKLGFAAKKYQSDENCTACGSCVKICPRGNITLQNKRPVWGDNCEGCNACIQWCPSKAIHMGEMTVPGMRSHNVNINIAEMMV